jgi:hypothetical protein
MPYSGEPSRHTAIATKACVHGQVVTEDNFVGSAFKVEQIDRWTRPADGQKIADGEEFEIQLNDILEAPLEGALADLEVGDLVYITKTTNVLATAGGATTLPVGVVDEIDEARTPAVARINTTALHAFVA